MKVRFVQDFNIQKVTVLFMNLISSVTAQRKLPCVMHWRSIYPRSPQMKMMKQKRGSGKKIF